MFCLRGENAIMKSIKKLPLTLIVATTLFVGCSGDVKTVDLSTIEGANIDQLYIVDCLLPNSVRTLGTKLSYLAPRRVIKTSGSACGIRGGEYVSHDRANYQTALKIWLPLAQGGDPKAQSYVGEIYEKGLGTQPNYQQAANWYQQAANQGYARAKMSLGSLYERGLGVPRSAPKALNLYRDASGLGDRQVEFVTAAVRNQRAAQTQQLAQSQREAQAAQQYARRLQNDVQQLQVEKTRLENAPPQIVTRNVLVNDPQQQKVIQQLNREVAQLRTQTQRTQQKIVQVEKIVRVPVQNNNNNAQNVTLRAQNAQLKKQLDKQKADLAKKQAELRSRQKVVTRAPASKAEQKQQIVAIEKKIKTKEKEIEQQEKKVSKLALRSGGADAKKTSNLRGVNFGNYYAVVIGNNNYADNSNLKTAVNDAQTVASVLKSQYGFKTIVLSNASKGKMLAAMDSLRKRLTPKDNLVIYYAGHGQLNGGRGFWLPSDAKQGDQKSWISNEQMTNFIDAMDAKHVLVVADSCYSGTLSQKSIPTPVLGSGKDRAWFDAVASTKVRVAMSSGGVKPVLDSGSGNHSVFANAFLGALRSGTSVMEGAGLFQALRGQVRSASSARGNSQNPRYAPIRFAGHEAGDFIFVKGGRVAILDQQPEDDDQNKVKRPFYAFRELLFLIRV